MQVQHLIWQMTLREFPTQAGQGISASESCFVTLLTPTLAIILTTTLLYLVRCQCFIIKYT